MKTKITAILAMVMLLILFVSVSAFAGTINYTYDNAGRLTGADYGDSKTIAFTYDNNGNLLKRDVQAPTPQQYTITVSANPSAGGTVTGGGTYNENEQVTVEATANANYSFVNWTEGGQVVSANQEYTFNADNDRTLVANFQLNQYIPTVTTTTVSAITSNSATSGGNVTSDGGAAVTARGVCWSTSANPTTANSKTTDGTGTGSFTSFITGLNPGTEYHVRAYATNSVGSAYGEDQTFTTTPATAIPTVATTAVSSITSNSASSGGNVTNDGGAAVTARGVCWSTSANPTTSDSHTTDGTGTGSFTSSITGLSPNTTYHVRAYATNSEGTGYGSEKTFTTTPATAIPTVTTTAVSSITSNSASSGGNVTNDGGVAVTARGVCWSTSANPTTSDSHTSDGTGTGSFTSSITGLSPNTTYHVRAYATNSEGTGYGSEKTFTTTPTTATKDELAVDFKTTGIYVYNTGSWNRIYKGVDPEGLCSFGTYLAVDFGTAYGLYVYDAGAWTRAYKGVEIEKMAGFGDKLAVDFGTSYPLYEYNFITDTWTPIYTYSSPRDKIEALGDKLVVDFKTAGIYVYDAGSWNKIYKGVDPVNIVSFGDKLAIDFGTAYGLYVYEYDTDNWTKVYKGVAIEKMSEIDGDLAVDFGTAYGLYVYEFDTDNWNRVYKGVAIEKMAGFDGKLAVDFGTTYPIYEYDFDTNNWNSIYKYSSPRDELAPANIFD